MIILRLCFVGFLFFVFSLPSSLHASRTLQQWTSVTTAPLLSPFWSPGPLGALPVAFAGHARLLPLPCASPSALPAPPCPPSCTSRPSPPYCSSAPSCPPHCSSPRHGCIFSRTRAALPAPDLPPDRQALAASSGTPPGEFPCPPSPLPSPPSAPWWSGRAAGTAQCGTLPMLLSCGLCGALASPVLPPSPHPFRGLSCALFLSLPLPVVSLVPRCLPRWHPAASTPTQGWNKHAIPLEPQNHTPSSAPTLSVQGPDFISIVGGSISRRSAHQAHLQDRNPKPYGTTPTPRCETILR